MSFISCGVQGPGYAEQDPEGAKVARGLLGAEGCSPAQLLIIQCPRQGPLLVT